MTEDLDSKRRREQLERLQLQQARQSQQDQARQQELTNLNLAAARRAAADSDKQRELTDLSIQAAREAARQQGKQAEILDMNLEEAHRRAEVEKNKRTNPEFFLSTGDDNPEYEWKPGHIYLGRSPKTGKEIGAKTDVHVMSVGASGYGKGASSIIQNLFRWPGNVVVIDAKGGENARETAIHRAETYEEEVFILDFFGCVPQDVYDHPSVERTTLNPLEFVDLKSDDAFSQLSAIANGMIIRDNAKDEYWQRGSETTLVGLLAHVIERYGRGASMTDVMDLLQGFGEESYSGEDAGAGPVDEARKLELLAILKGSSNSFTQSTVKELQGRQGDSFLSGVLSSTRWLQSPVMQRGLFQTSAGFALNAIKRRKASLYLVLPIDQVSDQAVFLRLFVKLLLKEIQKYAKGREILFVLDEFAQLGRLDEIEKSFGTFREYNTTLWPILQNWSQMLRIYGEEGANLIRGDCRIAEFFSADDPATCEYVVRAVGPNIETGENLLTPKLYAELIAKDGGPLARRKLVFMPGKPRLVCVQPQGYWNDERLFVSPDDEVVEAPTEGVSPEIRAKLLSLHAWICRDYPHFNAATVSGETYVSKGFEALKQSVQATHKRTGWMPSITNVLNVSSDAFIEKSGRLSGDDVFPIFSLRNPDRLKKWDRLLLVASGIFALATVGIWLAVFTDNIGTTENFILGALILLGPPGLAIGSFFLSEKIQEKIYDEWSGWNRKL